MLINIEAGNNIISKNNNDSVQILEQILPYFQPLFNISIKLQHEPNKKK